MKPNIVVITIDSLRHDKCFSDRKTSKTPNIDSLISSGVYFSQTICSADQTGTSLASIFTGNFPITSGLNQLTFNEKTQTVFDFFQQNDYHTFAAVPDIPFFPNLTSNFDDKFIYPFENKDSRISLHQGLGDKIIQFMDSFLEKKPWVFFTHLMDLHKTDGNFLPPEKFDTPHFGENKYDQLVSSIDYWIGKFLEKIDTKTTLLILSSDHGEYIPVTDSNITEIPKLQGILQKGPKSKFLNQIRMKTIINLRFAAQTYRKEHLKRTLSPFEMRSFNTRSARDLFDEALRVPLLISGCDLPKNKIIDQMIRHVDLFPTVSEIIDLKFPDTFDGISLLPLIQDKKVKEEPAYIEVGINLTQLIDKKNPITQAKFIGIRTSEYKYLRSRENPKKDIRLFNLKKDPLELENIWKDNLEIVSLMEEKLKTISSRSKKKSNSKLSSKEIQQAQDVLMKLGYI